MQESSSISNTPAAVPQQLGPKQLAFVIKAQETVGRVALEVLTTISKADQAQNRGVDWSDFSVTFIDPKQQALSELDYRTHQFFTQMMTPIFNELSAAPEIVLGLQRIETFSQDPKMGENTVKGDAVPHVKTMIKDLDDIDTSIVNGFLPEE